MRLGVVICGNGLGHAKRVVRVCLALATRAPGLKLSLFVERETQARLADFDPLRALQGIVELSIVDVDLPMRWHGSSAAYGPWLLAQQETARGWGLERFDAVLSDNLIEPAAFARSPVITGSFFWHDILQQAYPDNPSIAAYAAMCEEILANRAPLVICNRDFAMPRVAASPNARRVGLVPFEAPRSHVFLDPPRVLVAPGNAPLSAHASESLASTVAVLQRAGISLFGDPRLIARLGAAGAGMHPRHVHGLDEVDLVIGRGGLGTISDCFAAKVPMLYIDDPNPEIRFNQERLQTLGVGLSCDVVLQTGLLPSAARIASLTDAMAGLDLGGAEQAAALLSDFWNLKTH